MNEEIKAIIRDLIEDNPCMMDLINELTSVNKLTDLNLRLIIELHKYSRFSIIMDTTTGISIKMDCEELVDIIIERSSITIICGNGMMSLPWSMIKGYDIINHRFTMRRKGEDYSFLIREA